MKLHSNIVALLLSTGILLSCSGERHGEHVKKETPVTVTVATAANRSVSTVQGSGQIVPAKTAMISTRTMGFITGINVKIGDAIKKGQLLVTISNGDMLAKKAQAHAQILETEAALKEAQKDHERYADLFAQHSASQKEWEDITLRYTALKAKAEAARQMEQEVDAMLSYTNLTAPFAGVVTGKNMDAGSMANPGMPILVIEQSGSFQVNTSVTEAEIDRIKTGAVAEVMVESIGRTMTGTVAEISPSSQMSGGQYRVNVALPNGETLGLHSGMYARVSLHVPAATEHPDRRVMVPVGAIVYQDQLNGLYTISESQTALLRWVRLGKTQGGHVEILSGLREDEKFILTADGKLYNGVPVVLK